MSTMPNVMPWENQDWNNPWTYAKVPLETMGLPGEYFRGMLESLGSAAAGQDADWGHRADWGLAGNLIADPINLLGAWSAYKGIKGAASLLGGVAPTAEAVEGATQAARGMVMPTISPLAWSAPPTAELGGLMAPERVLAENLARGGGEAQGLARGIGGAASGGPSIARPVTNWGERMMPSEEIAAEWKSPHSSGYEDSYQSAVGRQEASMAPSPIAESVQHAVDIAGETPFKHSRVATEMAYMRANAFLTKIQSLERSGDYANIERAQRLREAFGFARGVSDEVSVHQMAQKILQEEAEKIPRIADALAATQPPKPPPVGPPGLGLGGASAASLLAVLLGGGMAARGAV